MDNPIVIAPSSPYDCLEWLNFSPVQERTDFFTNLDRCRDDGEKILLFMETAKRLDVPLRAIGELLEYQDEVLVSLTIQRLAHITNPEIRSKLVNLELIESISQTLAALISSICLN